MKRVLLCVISAMLVIAATPFAAGAASGPKANGTGQSPNYGQVHVNADDNGHGQDLGHFFIGEDSGPKIQGDVTCLRVEGNVATIGGQQRGTGMPFIIEVTDNGEPGHGQDEHRWRMAMPNEIAEGCPTIMDFPNPSEPIEQGNYIVRGG